jgi:hypothetical protein
MLNYSMCCAGHSRLVTSVVFGICFVLLRYTDSDYPLWYLQTLIHVFENDTHQSLLLCSIILESVHMNHEEKNHFFLVHRETDSKNNGSH